VAITDILTRIETDAAAEAAEITGAAEAEATRLVTDAAAVVAAERAAALAAVEHDAAEEAAMLMASVRLSERDRLLGEKRALAERVLDRARAALEALPDAEYLETIARAVAAAASGGETLSIASADAKRLAGIGARLTALGTKVTVAPEPAPIERGALLTGDRVRVEVSPASLVADRRDELLLVAARELFGGKE